MKDYMLIMTATQTSGGGDVTIKTIEFNSMDGAESRCCLASGQSKH